MASKFNQLKIKYLNPAVISILNLTAGNKDLKTKDELLPGPLFFLTSGRSGSTLLSCLLNNHPDLFIPGEQHSISNAILKSKFISVTGWQNFVTNQLKNLNHKSNWSIDQEHFYEHLSNLSKPKQNIEHYFLEVYKLQAKTFDKTFKIWGDKSPFNSMYVRLLKSEFPNCKIVYLVRDPRSVIASLLMINKACYYPKIDYFLWRWKDCFRQFKWLEKCFPDDVLKLTYEDLVERTEKSTQGVINKLGLPYHENLSFNHQDNIRILGVEKNKAHKKLESDVFQEPKNNWKKILTDKDVMKLERELSEEMSALGYELSN